MPFTLPASTGAASLSDAATTEAQQKTNFTNLRGFIAEMLGTDSTARATARSLLGVDAPTLAFAVASSALTIALKTAAGADAASTAPVSMAFRSATLSSGALNVRQATAALSLVVSSGSTLGTSNGVDAWLFIYALDNSGTVELAVSGTFYGRQFIGTTVAEGGAGAADSGTVIYSTTARSSMPMRLIGAARSNQATAGTWAAVPVECRLSELIDQGFRPVAQVQTTVTGTVATGTTAIPADNTIPQNTEGDQYMTLAITPINASSLLEIDADIFISNSIQTDMAVALFQDATAGALAVASVTLGALFGDHVHLKHIMTAGTTSATTFKIRAGGGSGGTATFNGINAVQRYGGVMSSRMTIREILP